MIRLAMTERATLETKQNKKQKSGNVPAQTTEQEMQAPKCLLKSLNMF